MKKRARQARATRLAKQNADAIQERNKQDIVKQHQEFDRWAEERARDAHWEPIDLEDV